jgi:hypothetical protein
VGDAALVALQAQVGYAQAREITVEKRLLDYHQGNNLETNQQNSEITARPAAPPVPALSEEEQLDCLRQEMLRSLPAWAIKENLSSALAAAPMHGAADAPAAVMVSGRQGCGKSVVIPLLLLGDELRRGAAQAPKDVSRLGVGSSCADNSSSSSSSREVCGALILVVVECSMAAESSARHAAYLRGEIVGESVGWAHFADGV